MSFKPSENFPYKHLAVLATVLFSSSIALSGDWLWLPTPVVLLILIVLVFAGLFPYVGFMVVRLHMAHNIDDAGLLRVWSMIDNVKNEHFFPHAGYTAGYVASAFMLGRWIIVLSVKFVIGLLTTCLPPPLIYKAT